MFLARLFVPLSERVRETRVNEKFVHRSIPNCVSLKRINLVKVITFVHNLTAVLYYLDRILDNSRYLVYGHLFLILVFFGMSESQANFLLPRVDLFGGVLQLHNSITQEFDTLSFNAHVMIERVLQLRLELTSFIE